MTSMRFFLHAIAILLASFLRPTPALAVTYDIVVNSANIFVVPSNPQVGQLAKVYVTIKSVGTLDVEGVAVFTDGETLIGRKAISIKTSGNQEDVWTMWIPQAVGAHRIRVHVVNDPGFPDASPENNRAEIVVFVQGDVTPRPLAASTTATSSTAMKTSNTSSTVMKPASPQSIQEPSKPARRVSGESVTDGPQPTTVTRQTRGSKNQVTDDRKQKRGVSASLDAFPMNAEGVQASDTQQTAEFATTTPHTRVTIQTSSTEQQLSATQREQKGFPVSLLWIGSAIFASIGGGFYIASRR